MPRRLRAQKVLVHRTLIIAVAIVAIGCLPVADDPAGREQAVELARQDRLAPVEGIDEYALPEDLAHTSQGGEVNVLRGPGDELIVIFWDFRGLDHYTGWVYTSTGILDDDPLGNHPFKAEPLGPNWFRVDAG